MAEQERDEQGRFASAGEAGRHADKLSAVARTSGKADDHRAAVAVHRVAKEMHEADQAKAHALPRYSRAAGRSGDAARYHDEKARAHGIKAWAEKKTS